MASKWSGAWVGNWQGAGDAVAGNPVAAAALKVSGTGAVQIAARRAVAAGLVIGGGGAADLAPVVLASAVDVRVSWAEFDSSGVPVDVRLSWAEWDTAAQPYDVRLSWAEWDTQYLLDNLPVTRGFMVNMGTFMGRM